MYEIEEPKSKTRVSGIPRIFKFLVTMDVAEVKTMLDDRMFSGPAELGPIADAIRSKAKEMHMSSPDTTPTVALLQGAEQAQSMRGPSVKPEAGEQKIAHASTFGTKPD